MSKYVFPEPGPEDFNERGELNFLFTWKYTKANLLRNLKDLPQEAAIILETARTSMISLIKSCGDLTNEQKDEWINVILEDKRKDEILENWWKE